MAQRSVAMESIRWAFKVGAWQPTKEQWSLVTRCIQQEEKERISRFVFQKDAKSALVGRLLLRKVIHTQLKIPYRDIKLGRTEKGKPFLLDNIGDQSSFNFNVSHQGEYAVLAAEPIHQVGVDVMQVEYPKGSRTIEEFFSNMNRQFTSNEWQTIKEPFDEWDQLKEFYRFWCLKESYVKAVGIGIGFSLQRLDFCPQSDVDVGHINCDTRVCVDDNLQKNWHFEETMLDSKHCLAVALQQNGSTSLPDGASPFQILTFEELAEGIEPRTGPDHDVWQHFSSKQKEPTTKR